MIGTIILWILAVLLAALLVLLLLPASVRFTYDRGALTLGVRFGPVKRQLFPKPEAPEKQEKPKKEKPAKKEKPKKEKPKKPKAKINMEQILYSLETLPPILGRALKRTGKRIRVRPLKVYLLVAGGDPADTAVLYGKLEAALAAGVPLLERVVHTEDEDIRLFVDFQEERMDCVADVGISLRPWDLVSVGVRALGSLIKWFLGFRRLASPPPPGEKTETGEQTEEKSDNEAA